MKPFCLGYISQVMWRLFVTFPRNGAGTCIPHPGPSRQTAQATPSSSLISPAPPNGDPAFAAKVVRAKFCCLQPTGDHNLGNSFSCNFGGLSLILVFWLSGRDTICLPAFLPLRIAGVRHVRLVAGWSCNLVPV